MATSPSANGPPVFVRQDDTTPQDPGTFVFFGCGYCNQTFFETKHLETHIRLLHEGATFLCVPAPMPKHMAELLHQPPRATITARIPLSEVTRHSLAEDCWLAINGRVYDLTEFLDRHPGGRSVILQWAGKDASKMFNEIHQPAWLDLYLRPESCIGELGLEEELMSDSYWHTLRKNRIDELREELRILVEAPTEVDTTAHPRAAGIPLSEVGQHHSSQDCWVAVNGMVYDLSRLVAQHAESRNPVLAFAGRDASPMWNRIPGRFPSSTWMEAHVRPEECLGELGPEPYEDPKMAMVRELQAELHRLEGPTIGAVGSFTVPKPSTARSVISELARFPLLQEVSKNRGPLPVMTRAFVSQHNGLPEPFVIIHNKVYNLAPLLGRHPGGDEVVLSRAGTDVTDEFEVFEHSEKARLQRDRELLIGSLVDQDCRDWPPASAALSSKGTGSDISEMAMYLRFKALDASLALIGLYIFMAWQKRSPLPGRFMYSRAVRHMHLLMIFGLAASLGTAHCAARSEGVAKKQLLKLHRKAGIAMLGALIVRILLRFRSGSPPRFPGPFWLQWVETQSLRSFYALLLLLPLSGLTSDFFTGRTVGDEDRNISMAKSAMNTHKNTARILEFLWLPFHLGYTGCYHFVKGRGVIRKVSPFI